MAGLVTLTKQIESLKKELSDVSTGLKGLPNVNATVRVAVNQLEDKLARRIDETLNLNKAPTSKDFTQDIADLQKAIDFIKQLAWSHGGGNANRNEQINSVNVLRPYTDINWIPGSNVTMTAVPNSVTKYTDITISSTGGGGSSFQQPTSGVVDGSNQVFVWTTAPTVIVVDQGRTMQRVSSDGTVNWTVVGTTTTLAIAPTSDIFALA